MKYVFIITDCSGSIISDGAPIGTINDLLRDLIREYVSKGANNVRVVCYNNGAQIYWASSDNKFFLDIPKIKFGGRSNLGKAYELIKQTIDKEKLPIQDCSFVLISDGEATDNFKKCLQLLDPQKKAYRVALSLGYLQITTNLHVVEDSLVFNNGIEDRDVFIANAVDFINYVGKIC